MNQLISKHLEYDGWKNLQGPNDDLARIKMKFGLRDGFYKAVDRL